MSIEEANRIRKAKPKTGTCWFCLKITMVECPELGKGWYKCSECGATSVEIPKPVLPVLMAGVSTDAIGRKSCSPRLSREKKVKK